MSKKIISVIVIISCLVSVQAQTLVPNGDFENWTDSVTASGWSSKISGGIYSMNFMSRTTDFCHGSYAAEIKSQAVGVYGVLGGIATTGQLIPDIVNLKLKAEGGIPCNGKPSKLNGYFKYSPVSGDVMGVFVYVTSYDFVNGKRDTLGTGVFMTNSQITSYTPFTVIVNYDTTFSSTPDTLNIVAYSSYGTNPHDGSVLRLDQLQLEYGGLGLNETQINHQINIFPSPSSSLVNVVIPKQLTPERIYAVNSQGKEYMLPYSEENGISVDISSLSNGIYYLCITGGGGIICKPFTVMH